jgi:hypothetical protein
MSQSFKRDRVQQDAALKLSARSQELDALLGKGSAARLLSEHPECKNPVQQFVVMNRALARAEISAPPAPAVPAPATAAPIPSVTIPTGAIMALAKELFGSLAPEPSGNEINDRAQLRALFQEMHLEVPSLGTPKPILEGPYQGVEEVLAERRQNYVNKRLHLQHYGLAADAETELEGVRLAIEAERDPVKRGRLAERARILRGHENLFH